MANENPLYKNPKPLIYIKGEPMVMWALKSLPFINLPNRPAKTIFKVDMDDLIFVSLEEHQKNYKIVNKLKKIFSKNINVVIIPEVTRGALESTLAAKEFINTEEELIVSDCDHYFDGENLYRALLEKDATTAGIIPVFRPPDLEPKWSYTLFDRKKVAFAVGEKTKDLAEKGAYANIGGYYFSKGTVFVEEAEKMISENDLHGEPNKQEFYVAPIYQRLINKEMKVKITVIPKVWGLGTPKDAELFTKNYHE